MRRGRGLRSQNHRISGITVWAIAILLNATWGSHASAACLVPHPRVCAEFFSSDAVFVGKVISIRTVPESGNSGFDEWIYQLKVQKVFRGQMPKVTEVRTENASGRFPLVSGKTYLLFARTEQGHLQITNCGNSSAITDGKKALADLKTITTERRTGGTIEGQVVEQSTWRPLHGIQISVLGPNQNFSGVTEIDGWFRIAVPSGQYRVRTESDRWSITAFDMSWDNPEKVEIRDRQCGLVQFIATPK
jgi:hypothetical protein